MDAVLTALLIDDRTDFEGFLFEALGNAGLKSDYAETLEVAQRLLATHCYSVVILSLGLSDGGGLALVRSLRASGDSTPILILSARAEVGDRVKGFEAGADDYVSKPFALEEALVRVRALLRRPGHNLGKTLSAGNIVLDTLVRQVFVENRPQIMSARDVDLLEIFIRQSGRVVSKSVIEYLWYRRISPKANTIEVYVHRLRNQLVSAGASIEILTVRGTGYRLETK